MDQWTWHVALVDAQCRIGFGPSLDSDAALTWLENFLPGKGVPVDKARARACSQKIGHAHPSKGFGFT